MLLNMGWKSVVFIGCLTYNDIVESKYSESKYIVNQIYIYIYSESKQNKYIMQELALFTFVTCDAC